MICRHCGEEIRLTNYKLPEELDVYIHVETLIQTCYDLEKDQYHKAQPV